MPSTREKLQPVTLLHKDGSLWATGQKRGETMEGYWVWFRKDGTKMRSGHFMADQRCGEWITYDARGEVYKTSTIKLKTKGPSQQV